MKYFSTIPAMLLIAIPLFACSFCGDSFARRQPLRERYAESKIVVAGKLKNAVANADGTGTTEFQIAIVLKGDLGTVSKLTIPRYLPVIGDTPPDYLFFCSVVDGKIEPVHGVPGSKALSDYLTLTAKVVGIEARLKLAFANLDSPDAAVSSDAFLEFARASDAELVTAKAVLDRAKLRAWIGDPKTPEDRVGVYGLLLGLCGDKADASYLLAELRASKPSERAAAYLGGLLGGAILLAPDDGWKLATELLADPKRNFSDKLNAISTLRFFQSTRPKESRERILACLKAVIANGDLADLAIDDLRRWQWWDLTTTVLEQYVKPTHSAPAIRRGIVRYALQCPNESAQTFLAAARSKDPELVKKVESSLKLYEKK